MPLSDDELERYARQIIIPGIGVQGQERMLAAGVLVVGAARGVAQASVYLRACGVTVVKDTAGSLASSPPPSAVIVAGADTISAARREELLDAGLPVCWYVLERDGFTCGLHPQALLPAAPAMPGSPGPIDNRLHDAAACDAAAVACALIAGQAVPAGPFRCAAC